MMPSVLFCCEINLSACRITWRRRQRRQLRVQWHVKCNIMWKMWCASEKAPLTPSPAPSPSHGKHCTTCLNSASLQRLHVSPLDGEKLNCASHVHISMVSKGERNTLHCSDQFGYQSDSGGKWMKILFELATLSSWGKLKTLLWLSSTWIYLLLIWLEIETQIKGSGNLVIVIVRFQLIGERSLIKYLSFRANVEGSFKAFEDFLLRMWKEFDACGGLFTFNVTFRWMHGCKISWRVLEACPRT